MINDTAEVPNKVNKGKHKAEPAVVDIELYVKNTKSVVLDGIPL